MSKIIYNKFFGFASHAPALDLRQDLRAFSLIEVIIALGVFSILAAGVFNIVTGSYKNFYGVGDKQNISEFAQKGIEIARAIRDNSWQDIEDAADTGGTFGAAKAADGYWEFTGAGSGSDTLGDLTRTIAISDVNRDTNNEITNSGGSEDVNTKKVVVTVTGTGIDDYVLTTYLTNWSTESWVQTDWSGATHRAFWAEEDMGASSAGDVMGTSTPGQIFLFWNGVTFNTPGSWYSSVYDMGSTDKELESISVEQNIPSSCNLDITLEVSDVSTFLSGVSSQVFSDDSTTYYTSSTPASLNGKKYLRYKIDMAACSGDGSSPTLYEVKINYR